MKIWSKHEKVVGWLFTFAVLLLIISCCPGGYEEATGILQGLATGILSGIVLLLVTGIKSKEYKQLTEIYKIMHKVNFAFVSISQSYSRIYHKTYHRKKENIDFETYMKLVKKMYSDYKNAYEIMSNIDYDLIPNNNIRKNVEEYVKYMDERICKIILMIESIKDGDKEMLNEIRIELFDVAYPTYAIYIESVKLENEIYNKKEHIDNSLL